MARANAATIFIDQSIGRKIQEMRLAKGKSRQQLSELIGVTHQQLQKYEKGTNRITAGRLSAIAKAFGVKVQYFFDDVENFIPTQTDHERLAIELSRVFLNLKSTQKQYAVLSVARALLN